MGAPYYLVQQTARAHGAAAPHAHARQDGDVAADPRVVLDHDVAPERPSFPLATLARVDGVRGAHQLHAGAEDDVVADADGARVGDAAVRTDDHVLADGDVVAVVAVEGGLDHAARAHGAVGDESRVRRRVVRARVRRVRVGAGAHAHDLPEERHARVAGQHADGRVHGRIVEAPHGLRALVAVGDQGLRVRQVVFAAQHLVAL